MNYYKKIKKITNVKKIFQSQIARIILLLTLSLALLLIRPFFFPNLDNVPDAQHYAKMVEFFRGNIEFQFLIEEFRSRILVPFIASLLPWDAITCLIIVNIIFTLLSVLIFNRFLYQLKMNEKEQVLGTLLFIIAGPTIIDGSLPLTDSTGLFFIILSLYFYCSLDFKLKKNIIIGIIISIGILTRESVIFVVPIIIIWTLIDEPLHWKVLLYLIIFILLIPILTLITLKILIPTSYVWVLRFDLLDYNLNGLFQPLTLATIAQLSLLFLIGIFGNYSKIINMSKIIWKLLIGIITFFVILIYIFFSASIASRFFWIFFIFVIPFFLHAIRDFGSPLIRSQK